MILLVAATEIEAGPLVGKLASQPHELFICGVGPLEAAVRLTRRLAAGDAAGRISLVLNFGVAGAYPGSGAGMLDLCLAEQEVLGDFGISEAEGYVPLPGSLTARPVFPLASPYLDQAKEIFAAAGLGSRRGVFVTVNAASGTARRGSLLEKAHAGLCENMEGAAVARVCAEFSLPFLEVRAISNMVEDREPGRWQLAPAIARCGQAISLLLDRLVV